MPKVRELFGKFTKPELMAKLEKTGLPFAPIAKPQDLIDDPHLNAAGGMLEVTLDNGTRAKLPAMPLEMNGERLGLREDLPGIGEHTAEVLKSLGYSDFDVEKLGATGTIRCGK